MGPHLRNWWGFGAAMVLAVHVAQAGDREPGAAREVALASVRHAVAPMHAVISADHPATTTKGNRPGEVGFFPVRAMEARLVSSGSQPPTGNGRQSEQQSTRRPERKGLTLFRVNPKFGDISVQPVFGGVNGAQVSVGF